MRKILCLLFIFTLLLSFGCAKKEKKVEKLKEEIIVIPVTKPEAEKHLQEAWKFINERKIDEAIKEYEKALKIQPDNGIILAGISSAYQQKGDKEKAIHYCREALKYQPTRQDCKDAIDRLEGKPQPAKVKIGDEEKRPLKTK